MYNAYSQKLGPPFSGQVQIVESDTYRAVTLDGHTWEIQYVNRAHIRVTTVTADELKARSRAPGEVGAEADQRLTELKDYLADVKLPFPASDHFECWVLDKEDQTPIAMVFSCSKPEHMSKFPSYPDWTALPDSVMSIVKTEKEIAAKMAPVNYRFERLVAERAGINRKGKWFDRREHDDSFFPPCLVTQDWQSEEDTSLFHRYIERQAPRLLMLQGLPGTLREKLEQFSKPNAMEVARFYKLYPEIVDTELIKALRVQARIRAASASGKTANIHDRRDGVLYI